MDTPEKDNLPVENSADTPKRKAKGDKRPPRKITEKYLTNAGLAYLQRFVSGTDNFRSIMMRKIKRSCSHHKEQDVDSCKIMLETVIDKFRSMALLDDSAYAKGMVTSLRRRGLSGKAIEYKLQQKKLSKDDIQKALTEIDETLDGINADYLAALRLARRKKIGPFLQKETPQEKQLASMARAGFSYEISAKILSLPKEEAEEILMRLS